MSYCAEIITFSTSVEPNKFLARRAAVVEIAVREADGLVAVPFCGRRQDGTWLDVWIYATQEAAETAASSGADFPEFVALMETVTDMEIEFVDVPDDALAAVMAR
ncbi:hypothetical protein [Rhodococcus wratislaviensis]|uniref:hypothetical protein n=1 Tax=Rhodococcus wratislaviensis TaxID=44752 RepID=UPI003515CE77